MITQACELYGCTEGTNPRHDGYCVRCGGRLDSTPVIAEPAYLRRDISFERDVTYEAAKGICDPDKLILHSETRARTLSGEYVDDASLVVVGRDRLRDVREELSDSRNHLVWWLQSHIGHEQAQDALYVLGLICLAYSKLLND